MHSRTLQWLQITVYQAILTTTYTYTYTGLESYAKYLVLKIKFLAKKIKALIIIIWPKASCFGFQVSWKQLDFSW